MTEHGYNGSCHCGAIGFRYLTDVSPDDWSVRACQCGFCRAHDALSTSDPRGELHFTAAVPECLERYRFALQTADFLICGRCGVYVGAVLSSDKGYFGIINTHALNPVPKNVAEITPAHYDDEDQTGRIRRREERWTPVTALPWAGSG